MCFIVMFCNKQDCVPLPTYADNVVLPAFAGRTPCCCVPCSNQLISPASQACSCKPAAGWAHSSKPAAVDLLLWAQTYRSMDTDGYVTGASILLRIMSGQCQKRSETKCVTTLVFALLAGLLQQARVHCSTGTNEVHDRRLLAHDLGAEHLSDRHVDKPHGTRTSTSSCLTLVVSLYS